VGKTVIFSPANSDFFSKRTLQIQLTFADPAMLIDENAKN